MMKHFKKMLSVLVAAFAVIAIAGTVKASAAAPTVTYNPVADTIEGNAAGVAYILKNTEATTIKTTAKSIDITKTAQSLSELGFKDGSAVYLYVAEKALEENLENAVANFVIEAPKANKITGTIDYTQADNANSTAVLSADVLDKEKKAITGSTILWSDGETAYAASTSFNGSKLKEYFEKGGSILIKVQGSAANGKNIRTSKAVKVKIAKQGKAPSVKLDVKKNTLNIKNGYEFALATKSGDTYTVGTWYTVLPYLRDAETKTDAASIVATASYLPLTSKDENAKKALATGGKVSFTSYKFKAIGLTDLFNKIKADDKTLADGFSFAVRKAATTKAPASAITYCDVAGQAKAPQMYTVGNISDCVTIAECTLVKSSDKMAFKAGKVVPFTSAWTGVGANVAAAENATGDKTENAKFEMAVVKKADLATIDWSTVGWKAIKEGTAIKDSTKTKYFVKGATTATTAVLTATETNSYASADTLIIVRRAGVKGKTVSESIIASDYLTTYVYNDKANKKYYWNIYKADDQVLVGAAGYKATVTLKTFQTDGFKAYKSYDVYGEKGKDVEFTLPKLEKGLVYDLSANLVNVTAIEGDTTKVKITKAADDANTVAASINVDTPVKLTIKYTGITKKDVIVEGKAFLGKAFDISDYAKEEKVGEDTYEATLPATVTNGTAGKDDDKAKVTATKTEATVKITYAKKAPASEPTE